MNATTVTLAVQNVEALAAAADTLDDVTLNVACDELVNRQLVLNPDATAALLADNATLLNRLVAAGKTLAETRSARRSA